MMKAIEPVTWWPSSEVARQLAAIGPRGNAPDGVMTMAAPATRAAEGSCVPDGPVSDAESRLTGSSKVTVMVDGAVATTEPLRGVV